MIRPAFAASLISASVVFSGAAIADSFWLGIEAIDGASSGNNISVQRSFIPEFAVAASMGFSRFDVGDTDWSLASLSLTLQPDDPLYLTTSITQGPARTSENHFVYRKAKVEVLYTHLPTWAFTLSDTYVNIDTTVGHIAEADVNWNGLDNIGLTLAMIRSLDTDIETQQQGLKLDYYGRTDSTWKMGIYKGRTRSPALLDEFSSTITTIEPVNIREIFIAVDMPIDRYTLTLAADHMLIGDVHRNSVSFVTEIPIGDGGNNP